MRPMIEEALRLDILFRDVAFAEEHRWLISRTSSISYSFMEDAGWQGDPLNQLYLDSSSKSEQRAENEKIAREIEALCSLRRLVEDRGRGYDVGIGCVGL